MSDYSDDDVSDVSEHEEEQSKAKGKRGRQVEEPEEEEEEEEEEEDARNDTRKRARIFFDEQADVDDDEEDEGDDDDHEDIIDHDFEEAEEDLGRRHEMQASLRRNREAETEQTQEDLERFVKERYERHQDREMEEDGDTTAIGQQSLLPTIRDTKLWVMQCRPGMEAEIVICMMQKSVNMEARGTPLLIKSVFFQNHLKGYIYIEADKESHVKEAMNGMRGLMFSKGIKLVPIGEMVDAVTVNVKAKQQVDRDSWVRVKSGIYKGDLAKVNDVDFTAGRCIIKVVPRLDYHALANRERVPFGQQPKVRPPQRAFSDREARDYNLDVERRNEYEGTVYVLNGNQRFLDGYALRTVSLKGVIPLSEAIPPLDELQRFNQVAKSFKDDEASNLDGELSSLMQSVGDKDDVAPVTTYEKGDKVKVVEGDLKELTGRVVGKLEDGKITVLPDLQDVNEELVFEATQLSKFFAPGDHVKCINGKHSGNTGMVVKEEDGICVVFSDMTKKEFRAFSRDLAESQEVAAGLDKIGEYDLHDLVVLDHQTMGVIVHVEKDACRVLTNNGTPDKPDVRVCRLPDIKRSIPSRAMRPTTDMHMNQVAINDQVVITDGPLKGRLGIVKYIQRGTLFIQSREVSENAGFCVVRSRNVRAKSGGGGGAGAGGGSMAPGGGMNAGLMTPSRPNMTPQSPGAAFGLMSMTPQSPGPGGRGVIGQIGGRGMPGRGGPGRGAFGGRSTQARRDNSLIGQTIKITRGQWCGYNGRVVDATDSILRLELEAQNRTITVNRGSIVFKAVGGRGPGAPCAGRGMGPGGRGPGGSMLGRGPSSSAFHGGSGGMTPSHPGMMGSQTPAHPSRTPAHPGSQTPRRGSQTPMRDSAWNPMAGAATPAHPGSSAPGIPSTPADDPYAAGTPAMTPFDKQTPGTPGGGYGNDDYVPANTPGAAYTPYAMADTPRTPADHFYNPASTPNDVAPTPGTPGAGGYAAARTPYDASTPGGVDTGTPFTPGMSATPAVHTPSHTPFTPGSGLGATPGTPGIEPMSPGLHAPGGAGADAMDHTLLQDLLVNVASAEGSAEDTRTGVVRSVNASSGSCTVKLGAVADDGSFEADDSAGEVQVNASEVSLVVPQKKNAVKIVRGEHRGQMGSLIGVDVADGIVKLEETGDIKIIEMISLGRLIKRA